MALPTRVHRGFTDPLDMIGREFDHVLSRFFNQPAADGGNRGGGLAPFGVDPTITIATLAKHAPVEKGQMVATVKIIPFAVASALVDAVMKICAGLVLGLFITIIIAAASDGRLVWLKVVLTRVSRAERNVGCCTEVLTKMHASNFLLCECRAVVSLQSCCCVQSLTFSSLCLLLQVKR